MPNLVQSIVSLCTGKIQGLEHNPASDLDVVAIPKPPVTHNPFLRMDELVGLMVALRDYGGANQTRLDLRLLLLTGVHTGELRLATRDQFDLEKRLWVIPAEVVKQLQLAMRKAGKQAQNVPPYIVPLSVQALEIMRLCLIRLSPRNVTYLCTEVTLASASARTL